MCPAWIHKRPCSDKIDGIAAETSEIRKSAHYQGLGQVSVVTNELPCRLKPFGGLGRIRCELFDQIATGNLGRNDRGGGIHREGVTSVSSEGDRRRLWQERWRWRTQRREANDRDS